jgi:hypothetical protein
LLASAVQLVQSRGGLDPDGLAEFDVVAGDPCVLRSLEDGRTQVQQLLQGEPAQDLGDRCPSVGAGSARRLLPAPLDAGRNGARLRERLGRATRPSNELQRELTLSPTLPSIVRTSGSRSIPGDGPRAGSIPRRDSSRLVERAGCIEHEQTSLGPDNGRPRDAGPSWISPVRSMEARCPRDGSCADRPATILRGHRQKDPASLLVAGQEQSRVGGESREHGRDQSTNEAAQLASTLFALGREGWGRCVVAAAIANGGGGTRSRSRRLPTISMSTTVVAAVPRQIGRVRVVSFGEEDDSIASSSLPRWVQ